jgi:hypothetical protein
LIGKHPRRRQKEIPNEPKYAHNLGPEVKRIILGFKMISLEKWVNI